MEAASYSRIFNSRREVKSGKEFPWKLSTSSVSHEDSWETEDVDSFHGKEFPWKLSTSSVSHEDSWPLLTR
jgi:hypothetical protein